MDVSGAMDLSMAAPAAYDVNVFSRKDRYTFSQHLFTDNQLANLRVHRAETSMKVDFILELLASYVKGSDLFTIHETVTSFLLTRTNVATGQSDFWRQPVLKSTFMPGLVFEESYQAFCIASSDKRLNDSGATLAVYRDSTALVSRHVLVNRFINDKFYSPVHDSWLRPENCTVRDLVNTRPGCNYELALFCDTGAGQREMWFLPMDQ